MIQLGPTQGPPVSTSLDGISDADHHVKIESHVYVRVTPWSWSYNSCERLDVGVGDQAQVPICAQQTLSKLSHPPGPDARAVLILEQMPIPSGGPQVTRMQNTSLVIGTKASVDRSHRLGGCLLLRLS